MAGNAAAATGPPGRRWRIVGAPGAAGLAALSIRVSPATEDGEGVVLGRNEVGPGPGGHCAWRGGFTNRGEAICRDVAASVRFLDCDGRAAGAAEARAERLGPGETLALEVDLPPRATAVQVRWLRWRCGGDAVQLGPYPPAPLGDAAH